MAFTRFYDDPDRIMKKLQESTDQGMYYLNCPGNGEKPPFVSDPMIVLQKWGANLHENRVSVESELLGINERLTRDCERKPYTSTAISYPTYKKEITSQPRSTMPVWTARDLEQNHRYILPLNPQEHFMPTFPNNISTRVLEKDATINKYSE
jgi:hypothetical protein